jgi:hypothetical protein
MPFRRRSDCKVFRRKRGEICRIDVITCFLSDLWHGLNVVSAIFTSLTDRKSLLALRGVGPESEAESVGFHGRRVTKVGPEVKHGLFRVAGRARNPKKLPPDGWGPLNKGGARGALGRCRTFQMAENATTGSLS